MKYRIVSVILMICMGALLCACETVMPNASGTDMPSATQLPYEQRSEIRIGALKGPTGIGMVSLMDENNKKTTQNRYNFELFSAPTEIVPLMVNGDLDIAAVPTNVAATLYQKTNGKVQLLALNTLGVLYVLQKGGKTISQVSDLAGKKVYMSGQGSTPEYAFKYILSQSGIGEAEMPEFVFVEDHSALAAMLIAGEAEIAVLPEPFVSTVLSKTGEVQKVLDLNAEWNRACGGESIFSMGCIIARKDFVQGNAEAVKNFLEEYENSVKYVNENTEHASVLTEQFGIIANADLAKKAIPNCNIVFISGLEMKEKTKPYLELLYGFNPQAIGGALPDENFYFTGE